MFNLSKIFGKETAPKQERNEAFSEPVVVEEKNAFDPELLTFNFTDQEIEKFKSKGMSDQEIELLRKTTLNKLERARFGNNK
jgi:hypothetical protein